MCLPKYETTPVMCVCLNERKKVLTLYERKGVEWDMYRVFSVSVMAAVRSLSLSRSPPFSSHSCGPVEALCPGMLYWTCMAACIPVAGYLLHHSSCYLKESATFALGLNYVQFAKLGLQPLGGGKALWPIYQCSLFLPVTELKRYRRRGRDRLSSVFT